MNVMRTTVMIWRNMKLKKIYDRMKVMVINAATFV